MGTRFILKAFLMAACLMGIAPSSFAASSLASNPKLANALSRIVHPNAFALSGQASLTFSPSVVWGAGGSNNVITFDDQLSGRVLIGGDSNGVWQSLDHGLSWNPFVAGFTEIQHTSMASIAIHNGVTYAAGGKAGCGNNPDVGGVYMISPTVPATTHWTQILSESSTPPVAFSGSQDTCVSGTATTGNSPIGHLFAFNDSSNHVFVGTYRNGVLMGTPGGSFVQIASALIGAPINSILITFPTATSSVLLVAVSSNGTGIVPPGIYQIKVSENNPANSQTTLLPLPAAIASAADIATYSPQALATYNGNLYIAAGNFGVQRCSLHGTECATVIPASPYFSNDAIPVRQGPSWTMVESRNTNPNEIWFGSTTWPGNAALVQGIQLWANAWPNGVPTIPVLTTLARQANDRLALVHPDFTIGGKMSVTENGPLGKIWWWAQQLFNGVAATQTGPTSDAAAYYAKVNGNVIRVPGVAFDPFQPNTILTLGAGPRRSDDNGLNFYLSDTGANGVVAERVEFVPGTNQLFASMQDWNFVQSSDALVSQTTWTRPVSQLGWASGFAFGNNFSFIPLIGEPSGPGTSLWALAPDGATFSNLFLDAPTTGLTNPITIKDVAAGTDLAGNWHVFGAFVEYQDALARGGLRNCTLQFTGTTATCATGTGSGIDAQWPAVISDTSSCSSRNLMSKSFPDTFRIFWPQKSANLFVFNRTSGLWSSPDYGTTWQRVFALTSPNVSGTGQAKMSQVSPLNKMYFTFAGGNSVIANPNTLTTTCADMSSGTTYGAGVYVVTHLDLPGPVSATCGATPTTPCYQYIQTPAGRTPTAIGVAQDDTLYVAVAPTSTQPAMLLQIASTATSCLNPVAGTSCSDVSDSNFQSSAISTRDIAISTSGSIVISNYGLGLMTANLNSN
jgi:hypothetical protein